MIVLASRSPRRAELLSQLQIPFETLATDVDERMNSGETPEAFVLRLALDKACKGWELSRQSCPVLGSDTIVVCDNEVMGKPQDEADFIAMMSRLSGRWHQVMTAVALVEGERRESVVVKTEVEFTLLSEAEMRWYWASGEPADKAGGYGIQGLAGQFVKQIRGSYSAVVGLPLYETCQLIEKMGIELYECRTVN